MDGSTLRRLIAVGLNTPSAIAPKASSAPSKSPTSLPFSLPPFFHPQPSAPRNLVLLNFSPNGK